MIIRHNIPGMMAGMNFTRRQSYLAKNLERLSSGLRVNRSADDAAGLSISEKMRRLITAMNQNKRNSEDGLALLRTGEGALEEVHGMLNRLMTLAEQSSNGTYDDTLDRESLQRELEQIRDEIDRVAQTTHYNGVQLFQDRGLAYETEYATDGDEMSVEVKNINAHYTTGSRTTQTVGVMRSIAPWSDGDVFELNLGVTDGTAWHVALTAKKHGDRMLFYDQDGLLAGGGEADTFDNALLSRMFVQALNNSDCSLHSSMRFTSDSNGTITGTAKEIGSSTDPIIRMISLTWDRGDGRIVDLESSFLTDLGGDEAPVIKNSSITLYDGTNADRAVFSVDGKKFAVGMRHIGSRGLDPDVTYIAVDSNTSLVGDSTASLLQTQRDDLNNIAGILSIKTGLSIVFESEGVQLDGGTTGSIRNVFIVKGRARTAEDEAALRKAQEEAWGRMYTARQGSGRTENRALSFGGSVNTGLVNLVYMDNLDATDEQENTLSVAASQSPRGDTKIGTTYISQANTLKTQIVPHVVNSILTNYPAFKYLEGSTLGIGLLVDNSLSGSSTLAYVRNRYAYGGNFQTYTLGVNPDTLANLGDSEKRSSLERTIAHEMIHAFMDEALTAGMVGADSSRRGQYPMWFVEGMAQTASGPGNWISALGLNASSTEADVANVLKTSSGQLSVSNNGRTASGGNFGPDATKAQYGMGYLACMYLGALAYRSKNNNLSLTSLSGTDAGKISMGISRILYRAMEGNSLDSAFNELTGGKYATVAAFESGFKNDTDAHSFVKALLPYAFDGKGGLLIGDMSKSDIVANDAANSGNLFALNTDYSEVQNTYPSGYPVFTGGGTTIDNDDHVPNIKSTASAVGLTPSAGRYQVNPFKTAGLGAKGTDWDYDEDTGVLTILTGGEKTITSETGLNLNYTGSVRVKDGVGNVTLKLEGASINVSGTASKAGIDVGGSNNVTVKVVGSGNTVRGGGKCAGIQVSSGTTLKLTGDGELTAVGGSTGGAGVGGGYGDNVSNSDLIIDITGTLNANGGQGAAGIGTGYGGSINDITIERGTINATAGPHGAGIGGGWTSSSRVGNITINGGNIRAISTEHGTGIGAGCQGSVKTIKITDSNGTGTKVYAKGGNDGAAIGASWIGHADAVEITGGTVNAEGGVNGAGIGSGSAGSSIGKITISGGNVNAKGLTDATGIGSGNGGTIGNGSGTAIEITGGTVTAKGGLSNDGGNIGGYSDAGRNNAAKVVIGGEGLTIKAGTKGEGIHNTTGVTDSNGNRLYALALNWKNLGLSGVGSLPFRATVKATMKNANGETLEYNWSNIEHQSAKAGSNELDNAEDAAYLWMQGYDCDVTVNVKNDDGSTSEKTIRLKFYQEAGVWRIEDLVNNDPELQKELMEFTAVPQYSRGGSHSTEAAAMPVRIKSPMSLAHREEGGSGIILQIGPEKGDTMEIPRFYFSAKALEMEKLDISTQENALDSIDRLRGMINRVSDIRGSYGAVHNALEHNINNLGVAIENLSAAESQIRDADYAEEMMDYSKNNILNQAAQAMLAQANLNQQTVMQLLQ